MNLIHTHVNIVLQYIPQYVEIKCQLDATEVFIADPIALLNMFWTEEISESSNR